MRGARSSPPGCASAPSRRPRCWRRRLRPRWSAPRSTRRHSPSSTGQRSPSASRSTTNAGRSNTAPKSRACSPAAPPPSLTSAPRRAAEGHAMSKHHVTTTINGEPVEFLCETQETMLDVLRNTLNLTGSKEGCASGDCGACSVICDGKLVCSCLMLGVEAEGRSIVTVEGVAEGDTLHPVQRKFLEHAALQCGFCTPGLIVASKALLDENPNPTEEEARYWLAGNLCRCTGYDKIIAAVLDAAAEMRGERSAA